MPYIGRGPAFGVRSRFIYTATASQTSFSGNDDAGITLAYTDTLYMDVYQNGVLLVPATDYAASTGTSVVLVQGASVGDTVEMLVYDIFSVADAVSAKDGGSFSGNVSMGGTLAVTDALTVGGAAAKVAGKESIYVPATAMYPSTTNGCATLAQVETTALRPDLMALDFATGADEFAQFSIAFPKSWNEGTVTFQPFWTVTGTNTGTVAWGLSGIAVSSDDSINTAFGTTVVCTALAHSGTSNDLMMSVESGAVTIAGSPAANDMCFFQVSRDVSADDQSGDARLLGIKVFFTTDAANDA